MLNPTLRSPPPRLYLSPEAMRRLTFLSIYCSLCAELPTLLREDLLQTYLLVYS
jgi:hypothetical protein